MVAGPIQKQADNLVARVLRQPGTQGVYVPLNYLRHTCGKGLSQSTVHLWKGNKSPLRRQRLTTMTRQGSDRFTRFLEFLLTSIPVKIIRH